MSGTLAGGLKARDKNLAQNPDFYKDIGRKGGQRSTTGGFASNRALARSAGAKGGAISKRHKVIKVETDTTSEEIAQNALESL